MALGLFIKMNLFDDLLKFSVARLVGIGLKLLFVLGYLIFRKEDLNFMVLKKIKDPSNHSEYYVHPSNRDFQKSFGTSALIFFVSNNCERLLQLKLFQNTELGFFGFLQGINDNLHLLAGAPFIEFLTNFFNLKFNVYWHSKDQLVEQSVLGQITQVYFTGVKYALVFFQLFFIYGSYMVLDPRSYFIFGSNYGNYVGLLECYDRIMFGNPDDRC